jgi:4-hydroxy-tetrahydrodipicolinate reductase
MIRLAITGSLGRMGQKIYDLAKKDKRFTVVALFEHSDHPRVNTRVDDLTIISDLSCLKDRADVLIDFTTPEATMQNINACEKYKIPIVIGTTGLSADQINIVHQVAQSIPVIYGTNMSVGVNVLFKAVELISKKLKNISDITVYEEHHIHKKDAPSGTAKTLAQIAEKTSGQKTRFAPEPLRQGEIIGNHKITFETNFDTLKLYHSAKDRAMFALGAIEAAAFLTKNQTPGLYSMQQVLNLDKIVITE